MITKKTNIFNNLITLEMANNHMGDFDHGKIMIDEFANVVNSFQGNKVSRPALGRIVLKSNRIYIRRSDSVKR